jgi:metal-responsive CopG/Arc/MetJ family transcriptional regulator
MNKKQKNRTINSFATGISMPLNILEEVDAMRRDVPRSRFILRMIEENLLQSGRQVGAHGQTTAIAGVARTSNEPTKESYNHRG